MKMFDISINCTSLALHPKYTQEVSGVYVDEDVNVSMNGLGRLRESKTDP